MAREGKRSIIRIQKAPKNIQLKAKKMNREVRDPLCSCNRALLLTLSSLAQMLMFWKRNEKDERENRKRAEKEALERAKKEEEERESKRQARKLNFLITQTELYSHFVGSKIKSVSRTMTLFASAELTPLSLPSRSRRGRAVSRHGIQRPTLTAECTGRGTHRRPFDRRASGTRLQRGCVFRFSFITERG